MSSILVVYGSTTGNTGYVAKEISKVLLQSGHTVEVKDVLDVEASGLCKAFDTVLFGCSTWGNDALQIQDDFIPFFEEFDKLEVSGKKIAVFGCGESFYPHFCGAVDAIEERLSSLGAIALVTGLKVDGDPGAESKHIVEWATKVAKAI